MISPSQRPPPDNTQHSQQTNIQALGGIRTHDLSRRAAVDLRLRPRGHWDRLTVHNECSKTPTVNLNALCNPCAKIACWSSESMFTFLYAGSSSSSIQNACQKFVYCIHSSVVNFASDPTPQTKESTELGLKTQTAHSRQPIRIRHVLKTNILASQWPILSSSKILTVLPASPCINKYRTMFTASYHLSFV